MSIAAGARLGPYEILAPLGAGGMGEVYRAKDTRLNRTVAIKVLPPHAADNLERRQRLDREARAIAALTHPHICTLYDIGHQDGIDYLVMEYLDGETLAARLLKGALPLDQVLRYSIEIADALDMAHRAGIVHRDLKPGNVMLTKSGAKLLDFGLAKTMEAVGLKPSPGLTNLPTAPAALTAKGTILGTLQYMAPEHLEGKDTDARTDIFALGTVIYEMATGTKAFTGTSQASLIAAILDATPPAISTLQPLTPPALDHVVATCLAKDPDERWQTSGDLRRELRWIVEAGLHTGAQTGVLLPPVKRPNTWQLLGAMVLALLVGAAVTGALVWSRPSTPQPIAHAVIPLPPSQSIGVVNVSMLAISPDGKHVVYTTLGAGKETLYVRALDQRTATPIPGTEGAETPFFSPDGQWVGFAIENTVKKVSLSGGQPTTICEIGGGFHGASWGADNTIVFNTGVSSGLSRVSAGGGTPQILTTPDRGRREKTHRWPEVLPGGKAVIFMAGTADITSYDDARIEVVSLETGARRVLIEGGMYPRYAPTGHLVYARAGALFAVRFDLARLEVTGTPVRILDGVATAPEGGAAQFAFSQEGSLVYLAGSSTQVDHTLLWVDRQGKAQPITVRRHPFNDLALSPDGRRLAVGIDRASDEIWMYDLERDAFSRLAFGWNNEPSLVWTPDGARITFTSDRAGTGVFNLYWQSADGSGPAERLTTSAYSQGALSWSPDGKILAFSEDNPATGNDIWMLAMDGDRKPRAFLRERFHENAGQFSPDGRWLAYTSTETGRSEIYVRPYPGPGGKWQISNDGGDRPRWARSGRELVYLEGDTLISVTVSLAGMFRAGKPQALVQLFPDLTDDVRRRRDRGRAVLGITKASPDLIYDVSPDGQRFATMTNEPMPQVTQINLVLNWFEELKRNVAAGK